MLYAHITQFFNKKKQQQQTQHIFTLSLVKHHCLGKYFS